MSILSSLFGQIVSEYTADWLRRGSAARRNSGKPGDPHPVSASVSWPTRIFGVVICAVMIMFSAVVVWSIVVGRPVDKAWTGAPILGALTIWLCIWCYDNFVRLIVWDETGVLFCKWNGARAVFWNEIVGLEEKSHPPHVRVVFSDGTGFGIHETMQGGHYFMTILERRLNPDSPDGVSSGKRRKRRRRRKIS